MLIKKVTEVPLGMIVPNPEQPRKIFGQEELFELRDSIREYGVIQPVILKKKENGTYLIIAGERRFRAATMAGLTKIPALVREADNQDAAIIALVENVQREDLGYMEEAQAYKKLMEEHEFTQGDLAERVGKKQSTISNKIRLLSLPEDIQMALVSNKLTERHARALLKIPEDDTRRQVVARVISHGLNVRQSEKLIEDILVKREEEERKQNKIRHISYKLYLNTIKKTFNEIFEAQQGAEYYQEDKGDFFEVKILIPKHNQRVINQ
ncbi:MAG: ParB/RepB/Spo0J family partition protein [Anaerovoracaceae bacterium]